MNWNYRVMTYKTYNDGEPTRLFAVTEVYYNEEGVPDGFVKPPMNIMSDWDEMDDLTGTHELVGGAFEKPILDVDNFPNEYKPKDNG